MLVIQLCHWQKHFQCIWMYISKVCSFFFQDLSELLRCTAQITQPRQNGARGFVRWVYTNRVNWKKLCEITLNSTVCNTLHQARRWLFAGEITVQFPATPRNPFLKFSAILARWGRLVFRVNAVRMSSWKTPKAPAQRWAYQIWAFPGAHCMFVGCQRNRKDCFGKEKMPFLNQWNLSMLRLTEEGPGAKSRTKRGLDSSLPRLSRVQVKFLALSTPSRALNSITAEGFGCEFFM